MATLDPTTLNQVRTAYTDMLAQVNDAQAPLLSCFADAQARRVTNLTAATDQLQKTLGDNDPSVVVLKQAAATADRFKVVLAAQATQTARLPKISSLEWLVFGQVTDVNGQTAIGRRVRVFDRDRKFDDLLGDTVTDDQGRFAVVYHQRDFAETRENLPELYVMVEDEAGQIVYSSRQAVRFNAGQAEYFDIRLGEQPVEEQPDSNTRPPRSKRPRAKKV